MLHHIPWRGILARLPLPMLALAASYGVYSYALLFVPEWVAIVQAAAFECTYIGLAVVQTTDRRRATAISLGAVVASVIYNSLSGWFHTQPDMLAGADRIAWLCLAVLHGMPLAWVAFLISNLLLHQEGPALTSPAAVEADPPFTLESLLSGPALAYGAAETTAEYATARVQTDGVASQSVQTVADRTCKYCGASGLTAIEVARHGRQRARTGACPEMEARWDATGAISYHEL